MTENILAHLATADSHEDPYEVLRVLRESDPVHRTRAGFYLLSRHADVMWMLQHTGSAFLGPDRQELERSFPSAVGHPMLELHLRSLLSPNPPEHLRLRKLIVRSFTVTWEDELRISGERLIRVDEATEQIKQYFLELLDQRERVPANDLISGLVAGATPGEFEDEDLVALLWGLWPGGFVPVAAGISQAVRALSRHPDQASWLERGRDDAMSFTNEILRHDGIVLFTAPPRIAVHDTRFGERVVPVGVEVRGVLAAANRDPAAFPEPDAFLPGRDTSASVAFSGGPHYCPAVGLARMEISIAVTRIRQRFPALEIAGEVEWSDSARVPTVVRLPVALKNRSFR